MSLLSPTISPFRVTAVLLWLLAAFAEAMAHGLILANRTGNFPPQPVGFGNVALLIALGVGLWNHSKWVAVLYVVLTSVGGLAAVVFAFLDAGLLPGTGTLVAVATYYIPTMLMIQRWSDLNSRK
jgi:hypothetical protein